MPEVQDCVMVEIEELKKQLEGNQIFARRRGKFGDIAPFLAEIVQVLPSPTAFCEEWDEIASDAKVLGNLLAKLKRDGKMNAFNALRSSLVSSEYLFMGESVSLEKTVPVTLLMLEPAKTMTMIQWFLECYRKISIEDFLDGKTVEETDALKQTNILFELFPSLHDAVRERMHSRRDYPGWDFLYAYSVDVVNKYSDASQKMVEKGIKSIGAKIAWRQFDDDLELYENGSRTVNDGQCVYLSYYFALVLIADQKEVLSHFSRKQQRSIATWQFHVCPELIVNSDFKVGLHPEYEHEDWQRKFPAYASCGVSAGWGAFLKPQDNYVTHKNSQKLSNDALATRVVFDTHP